jgi:para-aminobenzoate synthetase component 1
MLLPTSLDAPNAPTQNPISDPRAAWTFQDYDRRFQALHRHLRLGDCYQANLTFPVFARWAGAPRRLRQSGGTPTGEIWRARYARRTDHPVALAGAFRDRRERLDRSTPDERHRATRKTKAEDARQKRFLKTDEKNQAENRMIVDLLRNDISLVSEVGTLEVPELFRIETYPTVHQMVSRVRAKLLPELTIKRLFAALFPCGSVTGAPKIRAMEILRELERQPRDAYCGAIGWISPHGPMRFNVAIRTITLFAGGEAVYNIGGGIVFDSTAESEYKECLLKARFATGTEPISS